jgi:hypothetical protein
MLQRVTRRVPPVEQELLTFPGSHEVLGVVRVTQSLVLCSVLSDHCLSYCSEVHCAICSLIYGF